MRRKLTYEGKSTVRGLWCYFPDCRHIPIEGLTLGGPATCPYHRKGIYWQILVATDAVRQNHPTNYDSDDERRRAKSRLRYWRRRLKALFKVEP